MSISSSAAPTGSRSWVIKHGGFQNKFNTRTCFENERNILDEEFCTYYAMTTTFRMVTLPGAPSPEDTRGTMVPGSAKRRVVLQP